MKFSTYNRFERLSDIYWLIVLLILNICLVCYILHETTDIHNAVVTKTEIRYIEKNTTNNSKKHFKKQWICSYKVVNNNDVFYVSGCVFDMVDKEHYEKTGILRNPNRYTIYYCVLSIIILNVLYVILFLYLKRNLSRYCDDVYETPEFVMMCFGYIVVECSTISVAIIHL
jgi:hypothetical protein